MSVGQRPVEVRTGRLRSLLAVLAMSAGQTVPLDTIVAAVWDEEPPINMRRTLQTYVARLRGRVGAAVIATRPAGYALLTGPDRVDALHFLHLAESARQQPDPAEQRAVLVQALELWRGTPFADVPSRRLVQSTSPSLIERYLVAFEQRVDLDLARGPHADVVPELTDMTVRHPLRESLWVRLLIALERCGRPGEALARYETIRTTLAEELGTEPGPELQEVFTALLRRQAGTYAPAPPAAPPVDNARAPEPTPAIPRQLPPGPVGFTGRSRELSRLDALLAAARERTGIPAAVLVVHGGAGVGKTALAAHWGHRVRTNFRDGQLYADLRGRAPTPPVPPVKVLAGFLRALGEPPAQIPVDADEAAARYRSLMADRQMLVLLDNARDVRQVRPLIPASPGSVVLVTSRDRLSGLVVQDGAHRVTLGTLAPREATALLAELLPPERVGAEPGTLAELAHRCGYLPLALRIAAAHLLDRPAHGIACYTAELRDSDPLGALQVDGDGESALVASFELSYAALDEPARAMFRSLGLLVGHDVTAGAAAALAGIAPAQARQVLDRLASVALIAEHLPGRYVVHHLLRRYASGKAQQDPSQDREAARARYFRWYLYNTDSAARKAGTDPLRRPVPGAAEPLDVAVEAFTDAQQAAAWLKAERANLAALLAHTREHGPHAVARRLVGAMAG